MRLIAALGGATLVALFLFWLMQYLVLGQNKEMDKSPGLGGVDFVRLKRDDDVETRKRELPKKPPRPKKPPPPPKLKVAQANKPNPQPQKFDMPDVNLPVNAGNGPFLGSYQKASDFQGDGELIPLVRIAPQYPRRAARDRIEGWVKLEFTINQDGTVSNPSVVEAEPRRVFDQAARRAILKWKFKPRIVDGKPVAHRATQTIEFKLAQE